MFSALWKPLRLIIPALLVLIIWIPDSSTAVPVGETQANNSPGAFNAYGFNYVRVRNIHTNQSIYLIADHVVNHCCGDMGQLAKLTLAGNTIARDYVGYKMDEPLSDYNLQPVFSKCMLTEVEAEEIRQLKVKFFQKLGYTVVELPMELGMAGSCGPKE